MATGAAGFSALVALSLFAVSLGTAGIDDNVASAHTPACPSSIPTADGEFFWTDSNDDHWFIIRQTTNSGHMLSGPTLIRAYVASSSYDAGYVSSTPHDICFLKVRGPDDDEDLDPPVQILVWHDQDDSSDENTEGTQQPSAALWLLQAPGNSETAGLVTLGLTTFVYEGTAVTIVIILSNLESDSDSQTVDYRFRVRVMQGQIINLLCQGSGMNLIRELTTNADASIQTATIPGTCPVGTYTIEVELADGDDSTISNPISEGIGYLVIGPLPQSQQSGQGGGNGGGNGGNGNGGNGNGGNSNGGNSNGGNSNGGNSNGGNGNGGNGNGGNGNGGNSNGGNGNGGNGNGGNGNGGNSNGGNSNGGNSNGGNSGANGGNSNGGNSNGGNGNGGPTEHPAPPHRRPYWNQTTAATATAAHGWQRRQHGSTLDGNGNGGNSNGGGTTVVIVSECGDSERGSAGTPARPEAPILILTEDTTLVGVEWVPPNDNGSSILAYAIMYTPQGGTRNEIDAGGLSEILHGLTPNTTYEIRVSTCNAIGFSPWSPGTTIETASTPGTLGGNTIGATNNQWCGIAAQGSDGTPGMPDPPDVTTAGTDSITVQWTSPQDDGGSQIKIYAVQYTSQVGTSVMVKETELSTTVTGLVADTDYLVQVAACNAVGMSEWSPAATVRTNPESLLSSDDGGSDGGNNGGGGENNYGIVIFGTCDTGQWVGHTHQNDSHYWGGTVTCLAESLIDFIDPTSRGRMWTKSMMSDHRHAGFTDEDFPEEGNSCNADHVAAHADHNVLPCSEQ